MDQKSAIGVFHSFTANALLTAKDETSVKECQDSSLCVDSLFSCSGNSIFPFDDPKIGADRTLGGDPPLVMGDSFSRLNLHYNSSHYCTLLDESAGFWSPLFPSYFPSVDSWNLYQRMNNPSVVLSAYVISILFFGLVVPLFRLLCRRRTVPVLQAGPSDEEDESGYETPDDSTSIEDLDLWIFDEEEEQKHPDPTFRFGDPRWPAFVRAFKTKRIRDPPPPLSWRQRALENVKAAGYFYGLLVYSVYLNAKDAALTALEPDMSNPRRAPFHQIADIKMDDEVSLTIWPTTRSRSLLGCLLNLRSDFIETWEGLPGVFSRALAIARRNMDLSAIMIVLWVPLLMLSMLSFTFLAAADLCLIFALVAGFMKYSTTNPVRLLGLCSLSVALATVLSLPPAFVIMITVFAPASEETFKRIGDSVWGPMFSWFFALFEMQMYLVSFGFTWPFFLLRAFVAVQHVFWAQNDINFGVYRHWLHNSLCLVGAVLSSVGMLPVYDRQLHNTNDILLVGLLLLAIVLLCLGCLLDSITRIRPQSGQLHVRDFDIRGLTVTKKDRIQKNLPPLHRFAEWERITQLGARDYMSRPNSNLIFGSHRLRLHWIICAKWMMNPASKFARQSVIDFQLSMDRDLVGQSPVTISETLNAHFKGMSVPVLVTKLAVLLHSRAPASVWILMFIDNDTDVVSKVESAYHKMLGDKAFISEFNGWLGSWTSDQPLPQAGVSFVGSPLYQMFLNLIFNSFLQQVIGATIGEEALGKMKLYGNVFSFAGDFINLLVNAKEAIRMWCVEGKIHDSCHNFSSLEAEIDRLLQEPLPPRVEKDFVTVLDARLKDLDVKMESLRSYSKANGELTVRHARLADKVALLKKERLTHNYKIEPVFLVMQGASGTSKTTVASDLIGVLIAPDIPTGSAVANHRFTLRFGNTKHATDGMPNFDALLALLVDEIHQQNDQVKIDEETAMLHTLVSGQKMPISSASIESKATSHQLAPYVLIGCSNNTHTFRNLTNFDAASMSRRVDLVIRVTRVKGEGPFTAEDPPERHSIKFDFYKMTYVDVNPIPSYTPVFINGKSSTSDIKEFYALMQGFYRRKHEAKKAVFISRTTGASCVSGLSAAQHYDEACGPACSMGFASAKPGGVEISYGTEVPAQCSHGIAITAHANGGCARGCSFGEYIPTEEERAQQANHPRNRMRRQAVDRFQARIATTLCFVILLAYFFLPWVGGLLATFLVAKAVVPYVFNTPVYATKLAVVILWCQSVSAYSRVYAYAWAEDYYMGRRARLKYLQEEARRYPGLLQRSLAYNFHQQFEVKWAAALAAGAAVVGLVSLISTRTAAAVVGPEEDNKALKEYAEERHQKVRTVLTKVTGKLADVQALVAECCFAAAVNGAPHAYALITRNTAFLPTHSVRDAMTFRKVLSTGHPSSPQNFEMHFQKHIDTERNFASVDVTMLTLGGRNLARNLGAHTLPISDLVTLVNPECYMFYEKEWIRLTKYRFLNGYAMEGFSVAYGFQYTLPDDCSTYVGLCGAPIIAVTAQGCGFLVGIHHAGIPHDATQGYGQFIHREMFDPLYVDPPAVTKPPEPKLIPQSWPLETASVFAETTVEAKIPHKHAMFYDPDTPTEAQRPTDATWWTSIPAIGMGSLGRKVTRVRNSLRASMFAPFFPEGGPDKFGPPQFHETRDSGPLHALSEPTNRQFTPDAEATRKALEDLLMDADLLSDALKDQTPLSESQVLNGIPGVVKSMDMDTAAGFPFFGLKKKDLMQGSPGFWSLGPTLRAAAESFLSHPEVGDVVAVGAFKVEVRPLGKAARFFTCFPTLLLYMFKMVFTPVTMMLHKHRRVGETMIGANAAGKDWTDMGMALDSHGEDAGFLALDFKKYDKSFFAIVKTVVYCYFMALISKTSFTQFWISLARILLECLAAVIVIIYNDLFYMIDWEHSGDPVTVDVNTVAQRFLWRYWFYKNMPHMNPGSFKLMVVLFAYGDDGIGSVAKHPRLTQITFARDVADWGFTATSAIKTGELEEYTPRDKVTFLKREVVWDESLNGYRAPLDEMSIYKMLCWFDTGSALTEGTWGAAVVENAAAEWFLHGRDRFDLETARLRVACQEVGIDYTGRNFEEYLERYEASKFSTWDM